MFFGNPMIILYLVNVYLLSCVSCTRVIDLGSFAGIPPIGTSNGDIGVTSPAAGAHGTSMLRNPMANIDERKHRQMNSLASTNLYEASSSEFGYPDTEYGNYVSSGGGGGGGHSHYSSSSSSNGNMMMGGWKGQGETSHYGKGHGHHHHHGGNHGKKDCNSALGLLGTLGLISYLTTVLRSLTTTTPSFDNLPPTGTGGRSKRELLEDVDKLSHKITKLMIPLMIRVGQARDGYIPSHCTIHDICTANRILVKEIGPDGIYLGSMLSEAIQKMLSEINTKSTSTTSLRDTILQASHFGQKYGNCEEKYPKCMHLPPMNVPDFLSILKSPIGQAYTFQYSTY